MINNNITFDDNDRGLILEGGDKELRMNRTSPLLNDTGSGRRHYAKFGHNDDNEDEFHPEEEKKVDTQNSSAASPGPL
jgi:hypothetical protein